MVTRARRTSLSWAKALPCAAALALGCGGERDPLCSERVPAVTAEAPAGFGAGAPRADDAALAIAEGADTPEITVTVANAPDDRVLPVEAVHGSFDEPIVLVAAVRAADPYAPYPEPYAAPIPAPPGEKELVRVAISSAYSGGDLPVPLRLVDAYTGRDVTGLEMTAGQHAYLRVAGEGLTREATYRANLTIFGKEPAVYRLRIQSTRPHRPLGLRASKWADTFSDVPVLRPRGEPLRLVLPVDAASAAPAPYHVAVRPPLEMIEGARPLPACGIVARPSSQAGLILVQLPPLDTGRYAGVIEIQGEPLAVDITLKNPFWWVWLLVAAGAGVSLVLREYVRYRTARETAEKNIAVKEREIAKKSEGLGLLAWDELCVRNVVRLARGRKTYLALDDVAAILEDATPRERAERAAIDQALNETSLPSPLRAELRARLEGLNYIACREEVREIDRGIAELSREAQDGFQSALVRWLGALKERCSAAEERVLDLLSREPIASDERGVKRVKAALHVLDLLVEDARALALDSGLSQGQAEVLSNVEPALAQIEGWVRAGSVPEGIVAFIHCNFRQVAQPAEAVEPAPSSHAGLRIRARGVGLVLNANEEITFELVGPDGPLEDAAVHQPAWPVEWWIDRQRVVRGRPRLTYVFQSAGWLGWRKRRVEARVKGRALAVWYDRIQRPELSIAVYERTWSLGARAAATLVGVIVTGAAAVGILWANKAFGGWGDYIAAALTGLGADLAIVAGGGKLLDNVLEAMVGRRREEIP
jgi:hypothetical protein